MSWSVEPGPHNWFAMGQDVFELRKHWWQFWRPTWCPCGCRDEERDPPLSILADTVTLTTLNISRDGKLTVIGEDRIAKVALEAEE